MRLRNLASCFALLLLYTAAMAQSGNPGKTEAVINGKKVTITYGRPNLGGRDVLSLAQPGTVWRLGKDWATEIESQGDLMFGTTIIKAGKYSLWAKKTGENSWVLLAHPKTRVWGFPPLTDGFLAEAPLRLTRGASSAEELVITLANDKGKASVTIQWGTALLSGSIGVK